MGTLSTHWQRFGEEIKHLMTMVDVPSFGQRGTFFEILSLANPKACGILNMLGAAGRLDMVCPAQH